MNLFKRKKRNDSNIKNALQLFLTDTSGDCSVPGYTTLDKNPEIMTGVRRIAETIGSMTIHLMANGDDGDYRIINELSRKIDINPNSYMTRKTFIESAVQNLLLYGNGNSIILPHTANGLLDELEVIAPDRVDFQGKGKNYQVLIDGVTFDNNEVIHFVMNPDKHKPWLGSGIRVNLKDIADGLKQANATKKAFFSSKYKPPLIIKVDALTEEFSGPEGRAKLLEDYIDSNEEGKPWIIPSEQFQVEQVRPLSLADLAISDSVQIDKRTIAAILGVPSFLLGVGEYNAKEWNGFINTTIRNLVIGLQQEISRKLITSPKMYLRFNANSLIDWDIQQIASVYYGASDRGFVNGNEVRDKLNLSPVDGLNEFRTLENYIPYDMAGNQKKLNNGGNDNE